MPHRLTYTRPNGGYSIHRTPTLAERIALALMQDHAVRVASERPQPSPPRRFSWEHKQ